MSLILAFGLVAAACSDDEDPVATEGGDGGSEETSDGGSEGGELSDGVKVLEVDLGGGLRRPQRHDARLT